MLSRRLVASAAGAALVVLLILSQGNHDALSAQSATPTATPAVVLLFPHIERREPSPGPTLTPTPPMPIGQNAVCAQQGLVQICASVWDAAPAQHTDAVVYGRLLDRGVPREGLWMRTVWRYPAGVQTCEGSTGVGSVGICRTNVGDTPVGYRVVVDVTITFHDEAHTISTWFTPRAP